MPKNRKVEKVENLIKRTSVSNKLRIGTRKHGGVSAFSMSTSALLEVINKPEMRRYHKKARDALTTRGVTA